LNILIINTEKTWRGGERQTLLTIKGLQNEKINISLIASKNSPLSLKARNLKIKIYEAKSSLHALYLISSLASCYDLIHAQTGKSHTQSILTKFFHRKPILYSRRVDFVPRGFFTKIKYRLTNTVISISPEISSILEKQNLYKNSKVISSAVENSTPNRDRAKMLKERFCKENEKIVGLVAAFEEHKDPYTAMQVAKELRFRENNYLFIHFGDGALFSDFQIALSENNLSNNYFCLGHQENVEDFFHIMDVFIMTSKEEGLGSSVFDAFRNNIPVVSTNAGGLRSLLKDRGITCDVGDYKCLADGVERAIKKKKEIEKYIKAAKKYADNELSVQKMVKKYIKEYDKLINNAKN